MIKITINKNIKNMPPDVKTKFILPKLKEICKYLQIKNVEFEVLLCSNNEIQKLNNKYRNINEPTDVLSFNINEKNPETNLKFLGSIIISIDKVITQAKKYNCSIETELYRLLIHGLLHLNGQHHDDNKTLELVKEKTNFLLKQIGMK